MDKTLPYKYLECDVIVAPNLFNNNCLSNQEVEQLKESTRKAQIVEISISTKNPTLNENS